MDERISEVHLWAPTYGYIIVGRLEKTFIYKLCEDTECRLEDLQTNIKKHKKNRDNYLEYYWTENININRKNINRNIFFCKELLVRNNDSQYNLHSYMIWSTLISYNNLWAIFASHTKD